MAVIQKTGEGNSSPVSAYYRNRNVRAESCQNCAGKVLDCLAILPLRVLETTKANGGEVAEVVPKRLKSVLTPVMPTSWKVEPADKSLSGFRLGSEPL